MEKKKYDVSRLWPPSIPSKGPLPSDFVLVTPDNRKKSIVIGRTIYSITLAPNKIIGYQNINPPLEKGWRKIPHFPFHYDHPYIKGKTHWDCYYDEPTNYDDWAKGWKRYIDEAIEKKQLYIRLTDPILTYK